MSHSTEAKTRKELIDPALKKASWDVSSSEQVGLEIPVNGFDSQAWQRLEAKLERLKETGVPYNAILPSGVSDYVLYRSNGEIIAVVEAKRTSIQPWLAQAQSEFYVTVLEKRQSFQIPFSPQEKFAHIIHKYERLRLRQRQGEHLFQSLLYATFRGEL